jgi:hypothetical protein
MLRPLQKRSGCFCCFAYSSHQSPSGLAGAAHRSMMQIALRHSAGSNPADWRRKASRFCEHPARTPRLPRDEYPTEQYNTRAQLPAAEQEIDYQNHRCHDERCDGRGFHETDVIAAFPERQIIVGQVGKCLFLLAGNPVPSSFNIYILHL